MCVSKLFSLSSCCSILPIDLTDQFFLHAQTALACLHAGQQWRYLQTSAVEVYKFLARYYVEA